MDKIPKTGISTSLVGSVLNTTVRNISGLCTNININSHSYFKPFSSNVTTVTFDDNTYKAATQLKTYTIGDAIPSDANVIYNKPTGGANSPYRLGDFLGYDHYERICILDLDLPSVIDYGSFNAYYKVDTTNSRTNLLYLLFGEYWKTATLIIAQKGNTTRYFITKRESYNSWVVKFYLAESSEAYTAFKNMGIADYTCTIFSIAIPYSHSDKNESFHEVTSGTYILLPDTIEGTTHRSNIKITNPLGRLFYSLSLSFGGYGFDNAYIPNDCSIYYIIKKGGEWGTVLNKFNSTWLNFQDVSGQYLITNANTDRLWISVTIADYNGQRCVVRNHNGYTSHDGQGTVIDFEYDIANEGANDCFASFYFIDTTIRPENE